MKIRISILFVILFLISGCAVRISYEPSAMPGMQSRIGGTCLVVKTGNVSDKSYEDGSTYWAATLKDEHLEHNEYI